MKLKQLAFILPAFALPAMAGTYEEAPREIIKPILHKNTSGVSHKSPANSSYETVLTGFVYYAESWNDLETTTPMGIYTISTTPGSMPQEFANIGKASSRVNGGAVLAGTTFWYIWRQTDPSGMSDIDISQLYSYDLVSGQFSAYGVVSSELASTADKTWDPVSGKIYGQYTINGTRTLCVVDYEAQTVTPVGPCGTYYGLACDGKGQMYGIDNAGVLYKVDKNNGSAVSIGSTGIVPKYSQSMTIDPKTGDLWWASYTDSSSAPSVLYKVDTATAKATAVTVFDDAQEIVGLGVMPALAADGAPGYAEDLNVSITAPSTSATVTFSVPSYTYIGDPLAGEVEWKLLANGNELTSGKDAAGTPVSREVTLPTGDVKVSVVCSNSEGVGPAVVYTLWVGEDYPSVPLNVKLSLDESESKFSLSWDAVVSGENGGYVDPSKITYDVFRFPGNIAVASELKTLTFEERVEIPNVPVDTWYEVRAKQGWRESEPGVSNHIPFGKGFEVPYNNSFDNSESLALFHVIDGNGDGSTWKWDKHHASAYIFSGTDVPAPQDDWLITPGIDMKAGSRYELTYYVPTNMNDGRFMDRMEVAYGKGFDPSAYETVEEAYNSDGSKLRKHTVVVEPKEDGYYHFGFHCVSNSIKGLSIAVDDIHVDILANEEAPAAVSDLSLSAKYGSAPVTISFTTPRKAVNGSAIDHITKVEVWRNTTDLVESVDMTETGKQITVTDRRGAKGNTVYTVYAYNEHGVGERASASIFLGKDIPGSPSDITLVDNGNGGLVLSWDVPKSGANGGWCDPDNLTYNVYKVVNGFAADRVSVQGKEYNIPQQEGYYSKDQSLVVYGVSAVNNVGEGGIGQSTEVIIGNPYEYPFAESWSHGDARYDMWYRMNSGAKGWLPEANYSSDDDGGCMAFDAAKEGDMSYVCLGKVSMASAGSPKLLFDYYAEPGTDMSIIPEINLAFNGEFKTCCAISFNSIKGESGWREAVVDLSEIKNLPYICVRFLGVGSTIRPLRIDNVRIMDSDKTPNLGFSGIEEIRTETNTDVRYYDLNGMPVVCPQKGSVYIMRTSDGRTVKVVY